MQLLFLIVGTIWKQMQCRNTCTYYGYQRQALYDFREKYNRPVFSVE